MKPQKTTAILHFAVDQGQLFSWQIRFNI